MPARSSLIALGVALGALAAPASAVAQEACAPWESRTVATGLGGRVENLELDGRGGLFVSLSDGDTILRVSPSGDTRPLAEGIEAPGAMRVRWPYLYANTDNTLQSAVAGATTGTIERIDLRTGDRTTWARGLTAPNGMVLLDDGDALVSRALGSGTGVTRIDAADPSRPIFNWAKADETNGLALDAEGRWLYAAMTFTRESRIIRIDVRDPSRIEEVAQLSAASAPKGVDDIAMDVDGMLYLAANGSGEVLRLDPASGATCVLASGIRQPSSVRISCGPGWAPGALYVVAFDGTLRELKPPAGTRGAAASTACASSGAGPTGDGGGRRCTSRRAFPVRVRRGSRRDPVVRARVTLEGERLKVRRRRGRLVAFVDLRGRVAGRFTVRIVARTRSGRVLRDRRAYRTCART